MEPGNFVLEVPFEFGGLATESVKFFHFGMGLAFADGIGSANFGQSVMDTVECMQEEQ